MQKLDLTKIMQPEEPALIPIAQAARAIGLTKSTLWKQVQTGAIRCHDGKVILSEVIEDRAANIDHRQGARRRGKPGRAAATAEMVATRVRGRPEPRTAPVRAQTTLSDFSAAQARRENAVADMRQLEYVQKAGRLVDRAEVERTLFQEGRLIRGAWLPRPMRVQELMAARLGLADADLVDAVLLKFVCAHLRELSTDSRPIE